MPHPFADGIAASATAAALAEGEAHAAANRIAPAPLTSSAFADLLAARADADARNTYCVVVLGDPGVGKTAFIAAALCLDPSLRLVDPVDTRSPDLAVALCLPDPVRGSGSAACVILAFDLSPDAVDASLESLRATWLPALAEWSTRTGHALVCTLVGLCGDRAAQSAAAPTWPRTCQALMDRYIFIESALRCSAHDGGLAISASDVVGAAVSSARNPMRRLYSYADEVLVEDLRHQLDAIFQLFDVDGDGLLSNSELMSFQHAAFDVDVSDADIALLHARLLGECDSNVAIAMRSGLSGVGEIDGITLCGFHALIYALLVREGEERAEGAAEVWHCLRRFGVARGCIIDGAAAPSALRHGALDTQTRRAARLAGALTLETNWLYGGEEARRSACSAAAYWAHPADAT